jgi:hypothetical protein
VERWESRGLGVQLWKIPREVNSVADTAAKAGANEPPAPKFQDLVNGSPSPTMTAGQARVLKTCLGYETMYDDVYKHFTAEINHNEVPW